MKKKLILMGIAGALVVTTIISGSLALVRTSTSGQATSDVSTKDITIAIYEDGKEAVSDNIIVDTKVPGEEIPKKLTIKNTLDENIGYDTYVRVVIYKTWGEMTPSETGDSDVFIKKSSLDQLKQIDLKFGDSTNWYFISNDPAKEETVLYYKLPLKPGESTEPFLQSVKISETLNNEYAGKSILLEMDVDAVQKNDGVNAISSAWGVTVTTDKDGKITSIAE